MREQVEIDPDAPVDVYAPGMQERKILADLIITGRGIKEPLVIEPTHQHGVYTVPNGILITRFVSLPEVYEAAGIIPTPIDWC